MARTALVQAPLQGAVEPRQSLWGRSGPGQLGTRPPWPLASSPAHQYRNCTTPISQGRDAGSRAGTNAQELQQCVHCH
jgi:hypothetical protein